MSEHEHVTDDEWPSRVIQDYGTPNLLYISYVPPISNLGNEELEQIKADVETWLSFEIEKAESQIHDRLRKKNSPQIARLLWESREQFIAPNHSISWQNTLSPGNKSRKQTVPFLRHLW